MSKPVPFISLVKQHEDVERKLASAIKKVWKGGNYILGEEVSAFEEEYADFSGVKYCVGTASGLDALYLALRALGIGKGHEVIVPSNTCVPTWIAVTMTGARVVPVEPNPATFNIDPSFIEAAITPATKAIVPVHLFGQPCDMKQIMAIASKNSIHVVEDNAQAHGATFNGKMTGTFGVINATSFYPTKNLGAMGDGGAITTNNKDLFKSVSMLRNYGTLTRSVAEQRGINSRLDELQAAVLRVKLARLSKWNKNRGKIASRYLEQLQDVGDIILPITIPLATHAYHVFAIRTSTPDKLREFLGRKKIETIVHYPVPPHLQTAYHDHGFKKGQFPVAEQLSQTSLSIPIWPGLEEKSVQRIIKLIRAYFK
jgi:dTDP-4-amino-4,6-dideoxygalactose transaminase